MKVAVVVQRYGAEINGGAEQHARYVAEHLAPHVQVEVLTTCARDYITWKNELPEGVETINGVPVRRFAVARERDPIEFATCSQRVFDTTHSVRDELAWLDAEGPTSPALIEYITRHEADYDFFIFFSFRYPHSFYGARAVAAKAVLVPTAERDGALGLGIFAPIFRGIRAFMYNSYEERATIQSVSNNHAVPGVVVGIGSEIPAQSSAGRFRQKFGMRDRFAIYVGRIDQNKGCAELFEYFEHYSAGLVDGMHLVLIGAPIIAIPEHPRIHHLGFVDDQDKFDAIAAAELLIMPSYLESLSMVALEAWALGKPVLANAKCEVLQGQCLRSNAGLFYENFREFSETLRVIDTNPSLQAALGRNGRAFFERHYSWPVIEKSISTCSSGLPRSRRPIKWNPCQVGSPAADGCCSRLSASCNSCRQDRFERRPRHPKSRPSVNRSRRSSDRRRHRPDHRSQERRVDAISGQTSASHDPTIGLAVSNNRDRKGATSLTSAADEISAINAVAVAIAGARMAAAAVRTDAKTCDVHCGSSSPGDTGVRRCHRARGPRHSARAPCSRLRLRNLCSDR